MNDQVVQNFLLELGDTLRMERERGREVLLAAGMPQHQVDRLVEEFEDMHAGQVAMVELKIAGRDSIH